ncbi:MAG TPA: ATP-binding protein [archaeon]|nr:ATP-binding protein [archaeon]
MQNPPKLSSTKEIDVPKMLLEQIVGQDKTVELIRKAAVQRRNVLLVGLPGTGKSMLAKAMSEIMPVQRLQDILIYPNEEDLNNPLVKVAKAGDGQRVLEQSRVEGKAQDDNIRLISLILPMGWFLLSYFLWTLKFIPDVVYAATLILGGFLMVGFVLGAQVRPKSAIITPKLLVNNAGKKVAPFYEATGARAGALLGDVRHDPLQCHYGFNELYVQKKDNKSLEFVKKPFAELWDEVRQKYPKEIIHAEKGYEALMLPAEEKIYTLGYKDGKPVLSRILSLNRKPFEGELVDIESGTARISVTPEHKVDVPGSYKLASKVSRTDNLIKLLEEKIQAISR